MDPFDRTFLPAAAEAGLPMASIIRQIPLFRRYAGLNQTVLLFNRCGRPDRPLSADYLLLLTRERLVITVETRMLRHARLRLDAAVTELVNVTWRPDPRLTSIELNVTAIDGVRERFLIRVHKPGTLRHLDATLESVFPTGNRATVEMPAAIRT